MILNLFSPLHLPLAIFLSINSSFVSLFELRKHFVFLFFNFKLLFFLQILHFLLSLWHLFFYSVFFPNRLVVHILCDLFTSFINFWFLCDLPKFIFLSVLLDSFLSSLFILSFLIIQSFHHFIPFLMSNSSFMPAVWFH